jgi:hypothetical protein
MQWTDKSNRQNGDETAFRERCFSVLMALEVHLDNKMGTLMKKKLSLQKYEMQLEVKLADAKGLAVSANDELAKQTAIIEKLMMKNAKLNTSMAQSRAELLSHARDFEVKTRMLMRLEQKLKKNEIRREKACSINFYPNI